MVHLGFNHTRQVSLLDYSVEVDKLEESFEQITLDGFNYWAKTGFEIRFKRNFRKYLINDVILSGIMVIVSWVS